MPCSAPSAGTPRAAACCSSRTGWPASSTRTGSTCCATDGSSSRAYTPTCSRWAASTPSSSPCRPPSTTSEPLQALPLGLAEREEAEHDEPDRDEDQEPRAERRGRQHPQRGVEPLGLLGLGLDGGDDEKDARGDEYGS